MFYLENHSHRIKKFITVFLMFMFLLFSSVAAQQTKPDLSQRANDLINQKWKSSSYNEAIEIMKDSQETHDSRRAAMELIHVNRLKITNEEMLKFLDDVTAVMKDKSLGTEFRAQAIHTMGNITLTLEELGVINRMEAEKQGDYLLTLSSDKNLNIKMRAQAINILGILKIQVATGTLKALLSSEMNIPEIARPACISLVRIDTVAALPILSDVVRITQNSDVFGTAAYSLGMIKNKESMFILETNANRFPDVSSCANALSGMGSVITEVLKKPDSNYIQSAIRSTLYLWKEVQRERYKPLLLSILNDAEFTVRKLALERLIEDASRKELSTEKQDLSEILEQIQNVPEFSSETDYIESRLKAAIILPSKSGTSIKTQLKDGGIK